MRLTNPLKITNFLCLLLLYKETLSKNFKISSAKLELEKFTFSYIFIITQMMKFLKDLIIYNFVSQIQPLKLQTVFSHDYKKIKIKESNKFFSIIFSFFKLLTTTN